MFKLALLFCLVAAAYAVPMEPKNELTCNLCVDIVTDIDEWLTSDKTEQEIIDFVKNLCFLLGQLIDGFEETCNAFMDAQLPAIIDAIVNQNLNPTEVCESIGFCP